MKRLNYAASLLLLAASAGAGAQQTPSRGEEIVVTGSRLGAGLPGASVSVITSEDIARSPTRTLPELLGLEAGVQTRDLYGNGAARATVDIRGFGAAAVSNTLVLIDGRRLNDIDLAAIDYAGLAPESIARIEVVRGNAGAVLYGDSAVGGVVNIVTKSGAPRAPEGRAAVAVGSDAHRQGDASYARTVGPVSAAAYGSYVHSDGYRDNNALIQRNLTGDLRHQAGDGEWYAKFTLDDQSLGLPGARLVTPTSSLLASNRRGAATPFDHAQQNGIAATLGFTRHLEGGLDVTIDGGLRRKDQEAQLIDAFSPAFNTFVETELATWSLTPRARGELHWGNLPIEVIAGADFYFAEYDSDRKNGPAAPPFHRFEAEQTSSALYAQATVGVLANTDLSVGARLQYVDVSARDRFDAAAPGGAFGTAIAPLDDDDVAYAANLGIEHRLNRRWALFGRVARAFRLPNIDERIGASPFGAAVASFELATQTSHDGEIGARYNSENLRVQASTFLMEVKNELHFDPATFTNRNFDPTRRQGVEASAAWRASEDWRLKAAAAYARARFRAGPFSGNDVPLVAPWTANIVAEWRLWPGIELSAGASYVAAKRLDNDEANVNPEIPGYALLDIKIGGEYESMFWSAAVNNLFDRDYYNYGVASTFTVGNFNAYPLPGRTFILRAGARF